MAFDGTSLYPSAMKEADSFPDLTSAYLVQNDFDFDAEHFIIKCDVFLPKNLEFIPVPYKKDGKCYYIKGMLEEQYYNDVDIKEIIRFGGKIIKVHEGIAFSRSMENPFKTFIEKFFALRLKYKKDGNTLLDNAVKLILNSCYGKTVQKDIDTRESFTTLEKFKEKFDKTILDYFPLKNG